MTQVHCPDPVCIRSALSYPPIHAPALYLPSSLPLKIPCKYCIVTQASVNVPNPHMPSFPFLTSHKIQAALSKALSVYFFKGTSISISRLLVFGIASHISSGADSVLLFTTSPSPTKHSLII